MATASTRDLRTKRLRAALRSMAGNSSLDISFSANSTTPLSLAPTVGLASSDDASPDSLRQMRGQCDAAALAFRLHCPMVHRAHRPTDRAAAAAFDALEQTRIEALGTEALAGARHNLNHRLAMTCLHQSEGGIAEAAALYLREHLMAESLPVSAAQWLDPWRPLLDGTAKGWLARLAQNLGDQQQFATAVKGWLEALALLSHQPASSTPQHTESADNSPEQSGGDDGQDQSYEAPSQRPSGVGDEGQDAAEEELAADEEGSAQDAVEAVPFHYIPNRPSMSVLRHTVPYKSFITAHDEIVEADALASREELRQLRQQLDTHLRSHATIHTRLASRLQRLLLAQQLRQWSYDMEDGLIDNARLARLIVQPDRREIYKQEHDAPFRDTVVTLLIDNSGSMRGRPITIAAMSVDILARTLERCGVRVELLGFTTREWKGGQSRKDWEKAGKPADPGRLNDLRHIIYKPADSPFARTQRNLGLMLKDGLLKENIDGEALLWAHSRLLARKEERRILIIISDGAPVDDSTLSTNASGYLDAHLREVIAWIEAKSEVELLAIGIGHDVTRYYSQAVTLSDIDQLGDALLREMTRLFAS